MPLDNSPSGQRFLVGGRVQGVGFRPFVCSLANQLGMRGSVRNLGGQVEIVAEADPVHTTLFLQRLLSEHPSIARPELISAEVNGLPVEPGFRILPSLQGSETVLLPDQSVCGTCLKEMASPRSRRFRYPFVTCTQCGPRYTIIRDSPFDRETTSMAGFPLCAACQAEYDLPLDRRFHAQIMGCAGCGPTLSYRCGSRHISGNEPALARTVSALRDGAIVAVKGIGGYHLLCDARNDAVVRSLRARKQRPVKPLAVLFPRAGSNDLSRLRLDCMPSDEESAALRSPEKPIVLVRLRPGSRLSPSLAPGLSEIGALLPYSPLHELIVGMFDGPLVATSGNISGEPVFTLNDEAEQRLETVSDAFLHHDRPILRPADDGVVRVIAGKPRSLRLGRGSAPQQRALPRSLPAPVLALGGQMKVTVALGFGDRVVISPHLGDMDSPRGMDLLEATAATLQRLHNVQATVLACDAHDGYASARWARTQGGLTVLRVPHHRAHAAAVAGEFPHEARWLCFAWDGVGLGEDGTLWGGEALLGQPGNWSRIATFRPFAPPGGEAAAREPWRSAAALAWELGLDWTPPGLDVLLARAAWQSRLNAPATSSVGRLFDAAASFLGLVQQGSHEGEGPMAVEAMATAGAVTDDAVSLPLTKRTDGVWQADWAPLVPLLLNTAWSPARRAAAFHASLAGALVTQVIAAGMAHGDFAVGLAGGVFQNRRLSELVLTALQSAGFRAYLPISVPCNDAGLSFGQVIEAAARR